MKKLSYWTKTIEDIRAKHNQALKIAFRTGNERDIKLAEDWADLEEYALEVARGEGVYLI